jgi:glucose-1-phosphate thymidylyltransferase
MKALILAAGYATRLYPLTLNFPKPLLKVGGRPIVEHIIAKIAGAGADEIFIVTNDKYYPHFLDWSGSFRSNVPVKIINDGTKSNEDRLGAVGDINFVITNENIQEDLMIIAGDNLFEFDIKDLAALSGKKNSSAIAARDINDFEAAKRFGVLALGKDNKIVEFAEKPAQPKSTLVSTACYVLKKEDVEELKKCFKEMKPDNLGDFITYLISKKDVYAYVFSEQWFDIGSHEQLKEADIFYSLNR